MKNARRIIEGAAGARLEPWSVILAEIAGGQDEVGFFRRVGVIGIAHAGCQQGDAQPDVAATFDPAGTDQGNRRKGDSPLLTCLIDGRPPARE